MHYEYAHKQTQLMHTHIHTDTANAHAHAQHTYTQIRESIWKKECEITMVEALGKLASVRCAIDASLSPQHPPSPVSVCFSVCVSVCVCVPISAFVCVCYYEFTCECGCLNGVCVCVCTHVCALCTPISCV